MNAIICLSVVLLALFLKRSSQLIGLNVAEEIRLRDRKLVLRQEAIARFESGWIGFKNSLIRDYFNGGIQDWIDSRRIAGESVCGRIGKLTG